MRAAVVDQILVLYDMKWCLNPYRIMNKYGIIVQKSNFDLREKTLKAQYNLGFNVSIFKKTCLDTLDKNKINDSN